MSAASLEQPSQLVGRHSVGELVPWAACGVLIGFLAAGLCAAFDMTLLAIFRHITGVVNTGAFWPEWTTVVGAVVAVLVSVVGFFWLLGLRRQIGHDTDSAHAQDVRRARRYFLIGGIITYTLASPPVWLVVIASCYGPS